jgi:hypothetical protein
VNPGDAGTIVTSPDAGIQGGIDVGSPASIPTSADAAGKQPEDLVDASSTNDGVLRGSDSAPIGPTSDGGATVSDTGPTVPGYVNIEIISALLGPSKSDGTPWDGTGTVPASVTDGLAIALRVPGMGDILNFMASSTIQSLSKPDPLGTAQLDVGSGFGNAITLANANNLTIDTFEPTWPGQPGWLSVKFSMALKVRLTLQDEDLLYNDDVGVATITGSDLYQAWLDGRTYWVRVEGQTQNQLLAVAVQVTTAGVP